MDFFQKFLVCTVNQGNTEIVFFGNTEIVTFSQGILQQDNHICIFSPTHGLLEYARKLEVRAIFGAWRIVWSDLGGFWLIDTTDLNLPLFNFT